MPSSVLTRATVDQGTPQVEWPCLELTSGFCSVAITGTSLDSAHNEWYCNCEMSNGNAHLGSPEEFVDHCIEPMDNSPYVQLVGRRLLQKSSVRTEFYLNITEEKDGAMRNELNDGEAMLSLSHAAMT